MDHRLSFLAYPQTPQQQQQQQQQDWSANRTYRRTNNNNNQYHDEEDEEDDLRSDASLESSRLPEGWTLMLADDGKTSYYYNHLTGGMRFKHPGLTDSDGDDDYDSAGDDDYPSETNTATNNSSSNATIRLGESSSSPAFRPMTTNFFEERKIITADALKRLSMASSDDEDGVRRQLQHQQQQQAYDFLPQGIPDEDNESNVEKVRGTSKRIGCNRAGADLLFFRQIR
jgi:son of sevenless-like protein